MKQDAILKINGMGKAGKIFANISMAFVGVAALLTLVLCMLVASAPKDFARIQINGSGDTSIKLHFAPKGLFSKQATIADNEDVVLKLDDLEFLMTEIGENQQEVQLNAKSKLIEFTFRDLLWVCIAALLEIIMLWISLWFVRRLCKAFQTCVSPFEENVIQKMKQFAFSLIPWVLLSSITEIVEENILQGKAGFSYSINLDTIFAIVIILALTYIFQYGAMLQQESDETL